MLGKKSLKRKNMGHFITQTRDKEHGVFLKNYFASALQHNNIFCCVG